MRRFTLLRNIISKLRKSSFRTIDFHDILRLNTLKKEVTLRLIANIDKEDLYPYVEELRKANINSIVIFQNIKKEITKCGKVVRNFSEENFDPFINKLNEEIKKTLTCLIDQEYMLLEMKNIRRIKKNINGFHKLLNLETRLVSINETLAKSIIEKYFRIYGRDKIEKFCHKLKEKGKIKNYWIRGIDRIDFIIVLGRSLYGNIFPKPMFDVELEVAARFYKKKLTPKIIVTGKSPEWEYMTEFLVQKGVKRQDIIIESAAKNTVANILLIRAKGDIPPNSNVVIMTIEFHIYRAKVLCEKIFGRVFNLGYIGTAEMPQDNIEFLLEHPEFLLGPNPLSKDKYNEILHLLTLRRNFRDINDGDVLGIAKRLNLFGDYNDPKVVRELINYIRKRLNAEKKRK